MAALIAAGAGDAVHVVCPVGTVTRVLLPEALLQVRLTSAARRALGVSVERTRPQGVLRVEPERAGAAMVELRGATVRVRLALETVLHGSGGEIHLGPDGAVSAPAALPAPSGSATPMPLPPVTVAADSVAAPAAPASAAATAGDAPDAAPLEAEPTQATAPASAPASAAAAPAVVFDLSNLMRATPIPIGRREGLPGQPPMILVDALRGEAFVWLRFTLQGGARTRVRAVSCNAATLATYTQEPVGDDLRVVVQLARGAVSRKTRVTLLMDSGAEYRFALSSGTLTDLWRKLFR